MKTYNQIYYDKDTGFIDFTHSVEKVQDYNHCSVCGQETCWMSINFSLPVCSPKCLEQLNTDITGKHSGGLWEVLETVNNIEELLAVAQPGQIWRKDYFPNEEEGTAGYLFILAPLSFKDGEIEGACWSVGITLVPRPHVHIAIVPQKTFPLHLENATTSQKLSWEVSSVGMVAHTLEEFREAVQPYQVWQSALASGFSCLYVGENASLTEIKTIAIGNRPTLYVSISSGIWYGSDITPNPNKLIQNFQVGIYAVDLPLELKKEDWRQERPSTVSESSLKTAWEVEEPKISFDELKEKIRPGDIWKGTYSGTSAGPGSVYLYIEDVRGAIFPEFELNVSGIYASTLDVLDKKRDVQAAYVYTIHNYEGPFEFIKNVNDDTVIQASLKTAWEVAQTANTLEELIPLLRRGDVWKALFEGNSSLYFYIQGFTPQGLVIKNTGGTNKHRAIWVTGNYESTLEECLQAEPFEYYIRSFEGPFEFIKNVNDDTVIQASQDIIYGDNTLIIPKGTHGRLVSATNEWIPSLCTVEWDNISSSVKLSKVGTTQWPTMVGDIEKVSWEVEQEFEVGDKVKILSKSVRGNLASNSMEVGEIGTVFKKYLPDEPVWWLSDNEKEQFPTDSLYWVKTPTSCAEFLARDLELVERRDNSVESNLKLSWEMPSIAIGDRVKIIASEEALKLINVAVFDECIQKVVEIDEEGEWQSPSYKGWIVLSDGYIYPYSHWQEFLEVIQEESVESNLKLSWEVQTTEINTIDELLKEAKPGQVWKAIPDPGVSPDDQISYLYIFAPLIYTLGIESGWNCEYVTLFPSTAAWGYEDRLAKGNTCRVYSTYFPMQLVKEESVESSLKLSWEIPNEDLSFEEFVTTVQPGDIWYAQAISSGWYQYIWKILFSNEGEIRVFGLIGKTKEEILNKFKTITKEDFEHDSFTIWEKEEPFTFIDNIGTDIGNDIGNDIISPTSSLKLSWEMPTNDFQYFWDNAKLHQIWKFDLGGDNGSIYMKPSTIVRDSSSIPIMRLRGYYGDSPSHLYYSIDKLVFKEEFTFTYELIEDVPKEETTSSLKTAWEVEPQANNIEELISQAQPGQIWQSQDEEIERLYILPSGVSLRHSVGLADNCWLVRGAEWMFSSGALSGAGGATIFKYYFPFKLVGEKRITEFYTRESSLSTIASPEGTLTVNHTFTFSKFDNVSEDLTKEAFVQKLKDIDWGIWSIEIDLDKFYNETPLTLYPEVKVQAILNIENETPRKDYAIVFLRHSVQNKWTINANKTATEVAGQEGFIDEEKVFDNLDVALSHFQDLLAIIQSHMMKEGNQEVLAFEKVSWEVEDNIFHVGDRVRIKLENFEPYTQYVLRSDFPQGKGNIKEVRKTDAWIINSITGATQILGFDDLELLPGKRASLELKSWEVEREFHIGDKVKVLSKSIGSPLDGTGYEIGDITTIAFISSRYVVLIGGDIFLPQDLEVIEEVTSSQKISWEVQSDVVNNIDELMNVGRPYQVWLSVNEKRIFTSCYLYLVPSFQKVDQGSISRGGWYRSVPPDPSEFSFGKTLQGDLRQTGETYIPYRVFPLKLVCEDWRELLPTSTSSLKVAWEVILEFQKGDKVKILSKSAGAPLDGSGYKTGDTAIVSYVSPIGDLDGSGFANSITIKNSEHPIVWLHSSSDYPHGGDIAFLPEDLELVDSV